MTKKPSLRVSLRRRARESDLDKKQLSAGTYAEDHARAQRKMQRLLGTLEEGHLKAKPIFPQSVLGHLFMRKYGLSKEQRAQVIRSTRGSSRFDDVQKIMRASDFDDRRDDRTPDRDPHRARRHHALVVDGSGSSDQSSSEVSMDVNMVLKTSQLQRTPNWKKYMQCSGKRKRISSVPSKHARNHAARSRRSKSNVSRICPLLHSRTNMMVSQTVDKPLRRSSRPSTSSSAVRVFLYGGEPDREPHCACS